MELKKILKAYQIIRCNGLGFCAFRARYALHEKTGLLKRKFPARRWSQISLADCLGPDVDRRPQCFLQDHRANGRRFFFDSGDLPGLNNRYREKIILLADEICQNKFQYFFDKSYDLGPGPDWFLNPATGRRADADRHWCDINIFDPDLGDIKFVWEPSRFAWVYTLVRAYAATGDNKYVDKFWSLFESWLDANQPNTGPNYACGQECAIRLMAMCFALYGLADAEGSSVERKTELITAIAVHADRIEKNIDYAVSTRTNHSLTEAAGLYTTGVLFPKFQRSRHWVKLGKKVLTNEGLKQIYPDGSYIQHSMNYHRLMLQDLLWTIRLAQLNGDSFCAELLSRTGRAVDFLYQMQDEAGGRVPNYGANDGALIIPLNNCDYLDYRPVIQSVHYLLNGTRLYEPGPWDEDLLWLFGPQISEAAVVSRERTSTKFTAGGYYTIRSKNSWAMSRCHSYRSRVAHIDPLHLDLWADGINILRDCGSYKYFAPDEPELEGYFKSIWAHNTIIVDDASPLRLISRFMWLPRPTAQLLKFETKVNHSESKGAHLAYNRSPWRVIHSRSVVAVQDRWEIIDRLSGRNQHKLELRWHLPCEAEVIYKVPNVLRLRLAGQWYLEVSDSEESKSELLKSQPNAGYESLYYGRKQPVCTLSVTKHGQLPIAFKTTIWKEGTP